MGSTMVWCSLALFILPCYCTLPSHLGLAHTHNVRWNAIKHHSSLFASSAIRVAIKLTVDMKMTTNTSDGY